MKLLRAILCSFKAIFPLWCGLPRLLWELFWCLSGLLALVMSILLFPVLVYENLR